MLETPGGGDYTVVIYEGATTAVISMLVCSEGGAGEGDMQGLGGWWEAGR